MDINLGFQKKLVQELRKMPDKRYSIICDNLKRTYPPKDGNPEKHAVRTFSLAVARGECVGILGPNGAGKTSSINMVSINLSGLYSLIV